MRAATGRAECLAKRLNVSLSKSCRPTGRRHGLITVDDVLSRSRISVAPALARSFCRRFRDSRTPIACAARARRMSQSMSLSRDEIAMCTIFDDADIETWPKGEDITARLHSARSSRA